MTLSEFKAWFEGFTEGIEAAPTEAQFAKVKAKVALIDGAVTTLPIFVDRWWPRDFTYRDYSRQFWSSGNAAYSSGGSSEGTMFAGYGGNVIGSNAKGDNQTVVFDAQAAYRELGRVEAAA